MKRFIYPHFKDIFFAWRSFGKSISQARVEWENANLLLQNGIKTYKPVCYGEKICCGIERKSFFLTEKLKAQSFTDFLAQKWEYINETQKQKIIKDLGAFIRKIHDLNITLPDLYVWHLFLKEKSSGEFEFAVIDLHRMSRNVRNKKTFLRNLGRLHHCMIEKYFDSQLRRLFIRAYLGNDSPENFHSLEAAVKKYSTDISAKRNPKRY